MFRVIRASDGVSFSFAFSGVSTNAQEVKEAIATAFGLQVGSFFIKQGSTFAGFDPLLEGDWELVLNSESLQL